MGVVTVVAGAEGGQAGRKVRSRSIADLTAYSTWPGCSSRKRPPRMNPEEADFAVRNKQWLPSRRRQQVRPRHLPSRSIGNPVVVATEQTPQALPPQVKEELVKRGYPRRRSGIATGQFRGVAKRSAEGRESRPKREHPKRARLPMGAVRSRGSLWGCHGCREVARQGISRRAHAASRICGEREHRGRRNVSLEDHHCRHDRSRDGSKDSAVPAWGSRGHGFCLAAPRVHDAESWDAGMWFPARRRRHHRMPLRNTLTFGRFPSCPSIGNLLSGVLLTDGSGWGSDWQSCVGSDHGDRHRGLAGRQRRARSGRVEKATQLRGRVRTESSPLNRRKSDEAENRLQLEDPDSWAQIARGTQCTDSISDRNHASRSSAPSS